VSNQQRYVVGYGRGTTEADAVRAALVDARHHYKADHDVQAMLEKTYFGPHGMVGGALLAKGEAAV
jgi:hypothetical protein